MVSNGDIFTFRIIQLIKIITLENALNIGFFGFFVYVLLFTISFKGGSRVTKITSSGVIFFCLKF